MPNLLLILPALALLACGWFAGVWYTKREIGRLRGQLDTIHKAANEHASQARRHIRQLRAELAARPGPPSEVAAAAATAAVAAEPSAAATAAARRAAVEKEMREYDAEAARTRHNGFADTQVLDGPVRG